MCIAELKSEMKTFSNDLKASVQKEIRSESFGDKEAERLDNIFKQILKEKLKSVIQDEKIVQILNLNEKSFFYSIYEYYDEKKGEEMQTMFYTLNGNWFKVQLEILQTGCDEYELDYNLASELKKFFSEDPEKRRERLVGPLERQLEEIDRQLEKLDERKQENTYYEVKLDQEKFEQFFLELEGIKNAV